MNQLQAFRIFYNRALHPELLRLEKHRKRLLLLFVISIVFLVTLLYLLLAAKIPALSFFAAIPIGIYGSFVGLRIRRFKAVFKPPIVAKILTFLQLPINYRYRHFIPKDTFLHSRLFSTSAPYYQGEDYFEGTVGEVPFQVCELAVRDQSPVLNRMDVLFRGIFFTAQLPWQVEGRLLVFPSKERHFHTRSIKKLAREGGRQVSIDFPEFEQHFLIYANKDFSTVPPQFWAAILAYHLKIKKPLLVSIVKQMVYVAIPEHKDLLEPKLFQSNVNFPMALDFHNHLLAVTGFVEEMGKQD